MAVVKVNPIRKRKLIFTIRGTSPLVMHKWGEKSIDMMRQKHGGKKTKTREIRNPEQEYKDAMHVTTHGEIGIPAGAFKAALINAAHKDIGIEKTLVKKSVFVLCDDENQVMPLDIDERKVKMREDCVRVGQGSTDLRYRPEIPAGWLCQVALEIDGELLQDSDLLTLVDRAGFGVGLLEMRPEKGKDFGRFEVYINDEYPLHSEKL